jgi:hypothetical protein
MRLLMILILAFGLANGATRAQDTAQAVESAFLDEMFGDAPFPEDRFAPSFLAQVPYAQILQIIAEIKAAIGPPVMVRGLGGTEYLLVTATHDMPVTIVLDANNDIVGLLFKPPIDRNASIESLLAGLVTDGPYAYLVTKNGEVLHAHEADTALAVGSAFKLGILAVLNDQISAGERTWGDVAILEESDRSLPTGTLQTWPEGAPLTLHTAAALMISQSDNTATDILLRTVGREAVEAKLGATVISTREFFVLKAYPELLARYTGGEPDALAAAAHYPLPLTVTEPYQQGAEWYIALTTLCAMMAEVGPLDVMHINPGVAQRGDWDKVAFKGGSEIGVLNLTTRAIRTDGSDYCVAATWNDDAALNETALSGAYSALLSALARQ